MARLKFWATMKDALATSQAVAEQVIDLEKELPLAEAEAADAERRLIDLVMQREGGHKVEGRAFEEAEEERDRTRLRTLALRQAKAELEAQLLQAVERESAEAIARAEGELRGVEAEMVTLRGETLTLFLRLTTMLTRLAPRGHGRAGYGDGDLTPFSRGPVDVIWANVNGDILRRILGRMPAGHFPSDEIYPLVEEAFKKAGLLEPGAPVAPKACLYGREQGLRAELKALKEKNPGQEAEAALAQARSQMTVT